MQLKSAGGRIFYEQTINDVTYEMRPGDVGEVRGRLMFRMARATVAQVVVGRTPVADVAAYWRGTERATVQPFINPQTGHFTAYASVIETDALVVSGTDGQLDDLTLHSAKHALLNAAPAVTGLTQDEFGAHLEVDSGELVLFDDVPGGTGGCRMLATSRLDRWLHIAHELAECHQVQCEDACRGCLFLPARLCRQGNRNLDRQTVLAVT